MYLYTTFCIFSINCSSTDTQLNILFWAKSDFFVENSQAGRHDKFSKKISKILAKSYYICSKVIYRYNILLVLHDLPTQVNLILSYYIPVASTSIRNKLVVYYTLFIE